MRKNRKLWLWVVLGLLGLSTVGYVVYAQTTESGSAGKSFLARLAGKLGVTEDALLTAMYEARAEMLDEAVAAGKLTQAQADYLKAVLKAKLDYCKKEGAGIGPWFWFGPGPRGMRDEGFRGRGLRPCWGY